MPDKLGLFHSGRLLGGLGSRGRTAAGSIQDSVFHLSSQAEQLRGAIKHTRALVKKCGVLRHGCFQVWIDVRVRRYYFARTLEAFVATAESPAAKMLEKIK